MLALLSLPVPLPANPPRRLPVMRDFWQRWTNLALPPATRHPKASLPISGSFDDAMTTDAGTKLGPPATVADGQSSGSLPPRRTSGQGGNLPPRRPDTPRATAIFTSRRSRGSLPTSGTSRPRRQPATSTSRHTSGLRHFHQQTVQGLAAHFDHLPASAATCHPGVQTHLGLLPFSPADGFRAYGPQPVHHRRATIRCRHCCHCYRFRQIRGPFPDKTHLSRHDKQAY